jgi:hypothetical protein
MPKTFRRNRRYRKKTVAKRRRANRSSKKSRNTFFGIKMGGNEVTIDEFINNINSEKRTINSFLLKESKGEFILRGNPDIPKTIKTKDDYNNYINSFTYKFFEAHPSNKTVEFRKNSGKDSLGVEIIDSVLFDLLTEQIRITHNIKESIPSGMTYNFNDFKITKDNENIYYLRLNADYTAD